MLTLDFSMTQQEEESRILGVRIRSLVQLFGSFIEGKQVEPLQCGMSTIFGCSYLFLYLPLYLYWEMCTVYLVWLFGSFIVGKQVDPCSVG